MDTLFSSYTNLGSKLPKNDATITRKKDDATVKGGMLGVPMLVKDFGEKCMLWNSMLLNMYEIVC